MRRCMECGEFLDERMSICPRCGCPVKAEEKPTVEKKSKIRIKIMPIVSIVLGLVIIYCGIVLVGQKTVAKDYSAKTFNVESAEFGGDFYTLIYGASDTIVDELSAINGGIAVLSESTNTITNTLYYSSGIVVISMGIAVIAVSLPKLIKKEE